MKRAIFFLITVFLTIGGCYYLLCNKSEGEDSFFSSILDLKEDGEILPIGDWKNALIGNWKGISLCKNIRFVDYTEEDWAFKPNGEYECVFINKYYDESEMKSSALHIVEGGMHSGVWFIDSLEKKIVINVKSCEMSDNPIVDEGFKYINYCENNYKPNSEFSYGNFRTPSIITNMETFSKNKILITGRQNGNDSKITYKFTKVD